jgi:hypothetical protein
MRDNPVTSRVALPTTTTTTIIQTLARLVMKDSQEIKAVGKMGFQDGRQGPSKLLGLCYLQLGSSNARVLGTFLAVSFVAPN